MRKQYWVFFNFVAIAAIYLGVANNLNWNEQTLKGLLKSDARGYYAYLPAIAIYQDLSFDYVKGLDTVYQQNHVEYPFWRTVEGNIINKYPPGCAILMAPFFTLGHFFTTFSAYPPDGYSQWYQFWINLGSLIYALFGIYFIYLVLCKYGFNYRNNLIISWVIAFGTPLFYYAIKEPSMSHVYSFFLISGFALQMKKLKEVGDLRPYFFLAILLGLIFSCRAINILIVLSIPFLLTDIKTLKNQFQHIFLNRKRLGICIVGFLIGSAPIWIYYYSEAGSLWVYSYPGEHFDFSNPQIINYLFSYKKGFFLYTPIALLSMLGFFVLWKTSPYQFYSLFLFLLVLIYVFSSWWSWWYGGSFSSRVMIDYLVFYAILIGYLMQGLSQRIKRFVIIPVLVVLTLFCQVQIYQYRYELIHYEDTTKKMYWDNFLKIKR